MKANGTNNGDFSLYYAFATSVSVCFVSVKFFTLSRTCLAPRDQPVASDRATT